MISRTLLILLATIFLLFAQNEYQQVMTQKEFRGNEIRRLNPILFRAYPVAISQDSFEVYLITDILYDYLQFTLEKNKFVANFSIDVSFAHSKNNQIYTKTWQSKLVLNDFAVTNSRKDYFLTIDSLRMPPGHYKMKISYRDLQSKQKAIFTLNIILQDPKEFYTSPPLVLESGQEKPYQRIKYSTERPIALRQQLPFNQSMAMLLNIFSLHHQSIKIHLQFNKEGATDVLYQTDSTLTVKNKLASAVINLPFLKLDEDKYIFSIKYISDKDTIKQSFPIDIIWFNKPRSLQKLDYALEPLELIIPPEEYKSLKSGNKKTKQIGFNKFWKAKDPTPNTAFNEMKLEFYNRVDSADFEWGGKRRLYGWKREPGRTFLLYGKPDLVEDYSLSPVNPIMKWIYNLPDHKLTFTFRALNGRKNYTLIDEKTEPNQ